MTGTTRTGCSRTASSGRPSSRTTPASATGATTRSFTCSNSSNSCGTTTRRSWRNTENDTFVYANVPYRIKGYDDLLKDPKNTIDFDHEREQKVQFKKDEIGGDGALLRETHVFIYKVNFVEKIMATMLAKVSNFIPEGGIWMNTQRPEWNDANNALVGNGVSMVTLCYLRRFLVYFQEVPAQTGHEEVKVTVELIASTAWTLR